MAETFITIQDKTLDALATRVNAKIAEIAATGKHLSINSQVIVIPEHTIFGPGPTFGIAGVVYEAPSLTSDKQPVSSETETGSQPSPVKPEEVSATIPTPVTEPAAEVTELPASV